MWKRLFSLSALLLGLAQTALAIDISASNIERQSFEKRDMDSYEVYLRKRNAHACIMSIVFIVLFPLGAISIHLPISRIPFLRNTYLVRKVSAIHAPIQLLGFVMMVGGLALGIKIAKDLGFLSGSGKTEAHIVIGLFVVSLLIAVQPLLGVLQHRFAKNNGGVSVFGYVHRWIGRGAIILGIINDGLGLQLAQRTDVNVPTKTYARNFAIAGVLCSIWFGMVIYDRVRGTRKAERTGGEKAVVVDNSSSGRET